MVSTFTPNVQLEEPARGDDVGTWDVPVNNNMTLIDLILGSQTTIGLNNSPVVLSAAQFQAANITFNSTLTASVVITFPTSFKKPYSIYHTCTGSSAFTITLQTTAGGQVICPPPGETVDVINDGTNIRFKNLGRVGSYLDYCGSSMPNWNDGCTVKPYLNCDGSAVSSAVNPILFSMIGGTLPDSRGRVRASLNQTTGRMLSSNGGVDGNTPFAGGGLDSVTLTTSQMPVHNHGVTDPTHVHTGGQASVQNSFGGTNSGSQISWSGFSVNVGAAATGITIQSTGGGALHTNSQPTYIGGLTLIRAG